MLKIISPLRSALTIALIYLLIGGLWIIFSDRVLYTFLEDPQKITEYQTYKGWFFVFVTSVLLFFVIKTHLNRTTSAQQNLLISEERFRKVFTESPLPIMIHAEDGEVIQLNPAWVNNSGYSAKEIRTINEWTEKAYGNKKEEFRRIVKSLFQYDRSYEGESIIKTKNGEERIWDFHSASLGKLPDGRRIVISLASDATNRIQRQKELNDSKEQIRALVKHLESIKEDERIAIAREIHDEFGQALTGIKMDLSWIQNRLPDDQQTISEKINSTFKLIDETIIKVRKVSSDLRPPELDDLGLVPAIASELKKFEERSEIRCDFKYNTEDILPGEQVSIVIFRILQEALTNAARHSNAKKVSVELLLTIDSITLNITDDGRGFSIEELNNKLSFGILGMHERAYSVGGTVDVNSGSGNGTMVSVKVPLNK